MEFKIDVGIDKTRNVEEDKADDEGVAELRTVSLTGNGVTMTLKGPSELLEMFGTREDSDERILFRTGDAVQVIVKNAQTKLEV